MDELEEGVVVAASGSVTPADGHKRMIRAEVLRKCCHELKDQIDVRGIRLRNVVVSGQLDLSGLSVSFPLRFEDCEFDSAITAEGTELSGLSLIGCMLPGLAGSGMRVRRNLDISRSRFANAGAPASAPLWLSGADVGGHLLAIDTAIDGQGAGAVHADRVSIGGDLHMAGRFSSRGQVNLAGARVAGSVDLTGAHIGAMESLALSLANSVIDGDVLLARDPAGRWTEISGCLDIAGARISGKFQASGAVLTGLADAPEGLPYASPAGPGTAIHAARASVGAGFVLASGSQVNGSVNLSLGELGGVIIGDSCTVRCPGRTALDLTNADIRALFRLDGTATVEGTIRLAGAVIRGTLALHGQLNHPESLLAVGGGSITVDGDVYLDGLRTDGGSVYFRGASLGSLSAANAQLRNPGGYSISLHAARVRESVGLRDGFSSVGLVFLDRCSIGGRLRMTGASLTCPAPTAMNQYGHALTATSATVNGGMDLGWEKVSPSADFTDAVTTFLADAPAAWPATFTISGFSYSRFESPLGTAQKSPWDLSARCAWLGRQARFDPGPYEQAAKVFHQHGYLAEAEQILITQRKHARTAGRKTVPRGRRALDGAYAVIGYGYRPVRVLWLLLALLALVAISVQIPAAQATLRATNGNGDVYATTGLRTTSTDLAAASPHAAATRPDACGDGEVRCFNSVFYAVDTVIPLISLDQRSTWYPDPNVSGGQIMTWWLNLATMLGWLLSSVFALSLARLSRSP